MLISSEETLTDTSRSNALPAVWAPLNPVKLTMVKLTITSVKELRKLATWFPEGWLSQPLERAKVNAQGPARNPVQSEKRVVRGKTGNVEPIVQALVCLLRYRALVVT